MLFLGLSGRRGCGPQVRPGLWPNKVRSEEPREEELGWGAGGEGPADLLLPLPPALTPTFWQVRAGRADQVIASTKHLLRAPHSAERLCLHPLGPLFPGERLRTQRAAACPRHPARPIPELRGRGRPPQMPAASQHPQAAEGEREGLRSRGRCRAGTGGGGQLSRTPWW